MHAARLLAGLHRRWEGEAAQRWPWLRPMEAAADLIGDLFDREWSVLAERKDLTPSIRALGNRLVGRVPEATQAVAGRGPMTLVHGDASTNNLRTGPDGEVAFVDWEDVSAAPGVVDLAWLLVSSVEPDDWGDVVDAYGRGVAGLPEVLPAVTVQALLSLVGVPDGSDDAAAWIGRIEAAERWLNQAPPVAAQ